MENITFDERTELSGKSYDSSVLVLNFADHHVMLMYVLHTTIEITTIEFHPDHPNLLFGGCLSGQMIVWDFKDETTRIVADDDTNLEGNGGAKEKDDDDAHEKSTQSVIEMKQACNSMIPYSHKTHVCDMKFIPQGIKVDKKHPSEGETTHFITCAEDGIVLMWDSRNVFREAREASLDNVNWRPFLAIPLFRPDGSGEQGLSKILFRRNCIDPVFWAGSDEGDLIFVDWSKRPSGKDDDQAQKVDFMVSREGQRNYRPVLALEQSPFFEELIMTVHDFNF
jgi:WD40 repeat protein